MQSTSFPSLIPVNELNQTESSLEKNRSICMHLFIREKVIAPSALCLSAIPCLFVNNLFAHIFGSISLIVFLPMIVYTMIKCKEEGIVLSEEISRKKKIIKKQNAQIREFSRLVIEKEKINEEKNQEIEALRKKIEEYKKYCQALFEKSLAKKEQEENLRVSFPPFNPNEDQPSDEDYID